MATVQRNFVFLLLQLAYIIYFSVNNSIAKWIDTYFLINLKAYPNRMTLLERIHYIFLIVIENIIANSAFSILCCLGVLVFVISKRFIKSKLNRICLLFCIISLILGVYGGGRGYIYYFLIFSPFVVFGFITYLDFYNIKFGSAMSNKKSILIAAVSLAILLPLTLIFNHNAFMLKINKKDLVQYKFAAIINETKNATLLNYGTLDLGVYTATGITPNIRFFEKQNIDYSVFPLNMDEQIKYIKDKKIDYVVF